MKKDEIKIVISDFISLLNNKTKEEKQAELEEFADLITTYLEITFKGREETDIYKKTKDKYNKQYNKLLEKVSKEELEAFESSIFKMYEIDGTYLYLQGVSDGKYN